MGTAQYLSPEQAQGHAVTATSDLYSIGVMLYEMLAGRLPFEGDSAVAVALKHLSEQPPPISQWRPDVHPALEAVVMAALAKDPAHRWQSAEDFAAAPRGGAARRSRPARTAARTPPPSPRFRCRASRPAAGEPPPREPERERRWPWYAIGALALALVGRARLPGPQRRARDRQEAGAARDRQAAASEARAVMERAGFEVRRSACRATQPFDQVLDQDPNAGEEADDGLDGHARGVGRAGRGARAGGRTADRGTGRARRCRRRASR